jgi:hypothetical protein
MKHTLKTVSPYWELLISGEKTFEIRYDDRCFQKGDILELKHWSTENSCFFSADAPLLYEVTMVCHYCQKRGWCVLGIKKLKEGGK